MRFNDNNKVDDLAREITAVDATLDAQHSAMPGCTPAMISSVVVVVVDVIFEAVV